MTIRWRNGRAYGVVYVHGRRIERALKTTDKNTAQIRYAELVAFLHQDPTAYESRAFSLCAAIDTFLDAPHGWQPSYTQRVTSVLQRFQARTATGARLSKITEAHLRHYFDQVRIEFSLGAGGLNKERQILHKFFSWCVDRGLIVKNPVSRIKRWKGYRPQIRIYSDEEVRLILDASDLERKRQFYFLLLTGCRKGEMQHLTWNDVDLRSGLIHIRAKRSPEVWQPKNAKPRSVDMPPQLMSMLKVMRSENPKAKGYVFKRIVGITRDLKRIAASVGVQGATCHAFRHTHASNLIMAGEPLAAVMQRLGHSSYKMTVDTYGHLTSLWKTRVGSRIRGPELDVQNDKTVEEREEEK